MAWISTRGDPDALRELHEQARDPATGRLDHIMEIHNLHPAGLQAHYVLYRAVMQPTASLPKLEREMIALVVSTINACHY